MRVAAKGGPSCCVVYDAVAERFLDLHISMEILASTCVKLALVLNFVGARRDARTART